MGRACCEDLFRLGWVWVSWRLGGGRRERIVPPLLQLYIHNGLLMSCLIPSFASFELYHSSINTGWLFSFRILIDPHNSHHIDVVRRLIGAAITPWLLVVPALHPPRSEVSISLTSNSKRQGYKAYKCLPLPRGQQPYLTAIRKWKQEAY